MPQVQDPTRSLDRAEVDLLVLPQEFCTPDHPAEEVFRERHVCVVWRDSPLAKGKLTLERYMDAGHVVMVPPGANASSVEAGWPTSWDLSGGWRSPASASPPAWRWCRERTASPPCTDGWRASWHAIAGGIQGKPAAAGGDAPDDAMASLSHQ
jgi:DNA-binding transcriptional LysR family regulator